MKHHPIQISIPQPCSEDWSKMTPQEQGRFCDSCQKCVVDFTNFSDAELYQYLLDNAGKKSCGRFRPGQLNRPIQIPHQPHSQLYKWIIAAGLALVFVAAPKAEIFAQAPLITQLASNTQVEIQDDSANKEDTVAIRGTVFNEINEPVFNAVVQVMKDGVSKGGTVTDINGDFIILTSTKDSYTLRVDYFGYKSQTVFLAKGHTLDKIKINLEVSENVTLGILIIEYEVPIINPWEGGNTKTISSYEIGKSAY